MIFKKDKNIESELKDKIFELEQRIDALENKCATELGEFTGPRYDISILQGLYNDLEKDYEFMKNKVDICFNRYDELKDKLRIKNEYIKIYKEVCRNGNKKIRNCEAKIVRLKRQLKEAKERCSETEAALLKSNRQG